MKKIYTEEQVAMLVEQAKSDSYASGLEAGRSEMVRLYTKKEMEELTVQERQQGYEDGWTDGFKRGYDCGMANTRGSCCNNCPRSKENERSVNSAKP